METAAAGSRGEGGRASPVAAAEEPAEEAFCCCCCRCVELAQRAARTASWTGGGGSSPSSCSSSSSSLPSASLFFFFSVLSFFFRFRFLHRCFLCVRSSPPSRERTHVIGLQASRAKSHTLFRHSLKETLFFPLSPEFDSMNCEKHKPVENQCPYHHRPLAAAAALQSELSKPKTDTVAAKA